MASLVSVIAALILHKPDKQLTVWQTSLVLALAFVFYLVGTYLDDIVYDPLYGLKPSDRLKQAR